MDTTTATQTPETTMTATDRNAMLEQADRWMGMAQDAEDREQYGRASNLRAQARELIARANAAVAS